MKPNATFSAKALLLLLSLWANLPALYASDEPCTAAILNFPAAVCNASSTLSLPNLNTATVSTIPATPTGCPAGVAGAFKDRWFKFTVPAGRYSLGLTMEWLACSGFLCSSNPGFAWYSSPTNNCNDLVLQDCDGDDGAFASTILDYSFFNLIPGNTYWMRVWETDNQGGTVNITARYTVNNDFCSGALPLESTGTNCTATNINEPDTWIPTSNAACPSWFSNENGVWYTFNVAANTPQPISINLSNVVCSNSTGGPNNLQIGLWTNNNTCNLSTETFIRCADSNNGVANIGPVNLAVGNYYLYLDGNAGSVCSWNVSSPQLLTSLQSSSTNCYASASLIANTPSGTPPFTYQFSGGSLSGVVNNGSNNTLALTNPANGNYNVTITDSSTPPNSFVANTTITIPNYTLNTTALPTQLTCAETSLVVSLSSNIPNPAYLWNTGETTPTKAFTTPSTYTVTVYDSVSGCTVSKTGTIQQNITPPIALITGNNICGSNATVLVASGGNSYIWSNGATTPSTAILTAGTYTVTATGLNGCTKSTTKTIGVLALPIAKITQPSTPCWGSSTTLSAGGGSGYQWNTGATTNTLTLPPLTPVITYTVTVTGTNGCTKTATRKPAYLSGPSCGTTSGGSGVQRNSSPPKDPAVHLFPNPAEQSFNLLFDKSAQTLIVRITDIAGRSIKTFEHTDITEGQTLDFDISTWRTGVYLVHIEQYSSQNDTFSTQVIKLMKF
jgi:Secretion system C-terminal sorting domain